MDLRVPFKYKRPRPGKNMSQRAGQYNPIPRRNPEEEEDDNDSRRRRPNATSSRDSPSSGSSSGAATSRGPSSGAATSRGAPHNSSSSRGSPAGMTGSRSDGSYRSFYAWEDRRGMTITSGSICLKKDAKNLVGISIGGGAPYCPCLYVVQVFDKTPAAIDGGIMAGDEITSVNGMSVKGKSRLQVAKMIQEINHQVSINFNKLHANTEQGKGVDLSMKKVKHRLVESMSSTTADALGLSRAILCNDTLVKKLEDLEKTATTFRGLIHHTRKLLWTMLSLADVYRELAGVFGEVGVHSPFPSASETFVAVGHAHRDLERVSVSVVRALRPMMSDLGTFLNQAIPDIRMTIKKYADIKFEYLSYCLKVKEMDDEEYAAAVIDDPLYRVETGNYDYRVVLRCRQLARASFAKARNDVMVKLELLEAKHVQDTVFQLQRMVANLQRLNDDSVKILKNLQGHFPVEIELHRVSGVVFPTDAFDDGDDDDDYDDDLINEGEISETNGMPNGEAETPREELLLDLG